MITLIVPVGRQGGPARVQLPLDVARWLHRELGAALGEPRPPRRPVRLRRGRWVAPARNIPTHFTAYPRN